MSRNGYMYIIQPVPEPGLILLIVGPVAFGLCRRRRGLKRGIVYAEDSVGRLRSSR